MPHRYTPDPHHALVLIGGGGHAAVVLDAARQAGWRVDGFYDDNPDAPLASEAPHLGTIREIALEYALLSPFTAFIAVDASRVTEGDFGVSTVQPVNMPEGVRYETTVSDER